MKIGTIALLVVGVIVVNPVLQMPAFTQFIGGGGPIVPGPLFPFVFITIACGAISGFHALIASGTTPKMIDNESDIRADRLRRDADGGAGRHRVAHRRRAMHPGDYFAINTSPAVFATLGMTVTNLPALEAAVQETVTGRTGGAVSLAVGMAQIFAGLPGMRHLLDYWYHFAIMFEALFILTTIDAGTRVARFLVGEFLGRAYPPFARHDWLPGAMISTVPRRRRLGLLHLGRQHLDDLADVRHRQPAPRGRRAGGRDDGDHQRGPGALRVGDAPAARVRRDHDADRRRPQRPRQLLPDGDRPDPAKHFQGYLNSIVTVGMMMCVLVILASAIMRWIGVHVWTD